MLNEAIPGIRARRLDASLRVNTADRNFELVEATPSSGQDAVQDSVRGTLSDHRTLARSVQQRRVSSTDHKSKISNSARAAFECIPVAQNLVPLCTVGEVPTGTLGVKVLEDLYDVVSGVRVSVVVVLLHLFVEPVAAEVVVRFQGLRIMVDIESIEDGR